MSPAGGGRGWMRQNIFYNNECPTDMDVATGFRIHDTKKKELAKI
jgi:hypothetical protein